MRSRARRFFFATGVFQLVAAVIGVIGVVNAQLATVLDRSTEIPVLRTIGFATGDVTVLLECDPLGALGAGGERRRHWRHG